MSDYGITITWGSSKPGRESAGLALWGDALTHAEKLKANGRIADYEVILFGPAGSSLPAGAFTLWGTQEQIKDVLFDSEREQLIMRTALLNENVAEVRSIRGAAIMEGMTDYTNVIGSLSD